MSKPTKPDDKTSDQSHAPVQPDTSLAPGFWSFENFRSLGILILIIFAMRWSIASPYHVPTASMEPTIKVGDRLLAYKLAYGFKIPFIDKPVIEWGQPKRGDIIVFKYPRDPEMDYVKRVVGVAGDEIQIIDDILHVNGQAMERVDHNHDRSILDDIEDNREVKLLFKEKLDGLEHWTLQNIATARRFTKTSWPPPGSPPYKVPENSVFCVGDNRDNSTDSRVWGEVPLDYVRGKALVVIWSIYSPPEAKWPMLRFSRFGHVLDN